MGVILAGTPNKTYRGISGTVTAAEFGHLLERESGTDMLSGDDRGMDSRDM